MELKRIPFKGYTCNIGRTLDPLHFSVSWTSRLQYFNSESSSAISTALLWKRSNVELPCECNFSELVALATKVLAISNKTFQIPRRTSVKIWIQSLVLHKKLPRLSNCGCKKIKGNESCTTRTKWSLYWKYFVPQADDIFTGDTTINLSKNNIIPNEYCKGSANKFPLFDERWTHELVFIENFKCQTSYGWLDIWQHHNLEIFAILYQHHNSFPAKMSGFEPNKRHLRKLLIYFNVRKSAAEAHQLHMVRMKRML